MAKLTREEALEELNRYRCIFTDAHYEGTSDAHQHEIGASLKRVYEALAKPAAFPDWRSWKEVRGGDLDKMLIMRAPAGALRAMTLKTLRFMCERGPHVVREAVVRSRFIEIPPEEIQAGDTGTSWPPPGLNSAGPMSNKEAETDGTE